MQYWLISKEICAIQFGTKAQYFLLGQLKELQDSRQDIEDPKENRYSD